VLRAIFEDLNELSVRSSKNETFRLPPSNVIPFSKIGKRNATLRDFKIECMDVEDIFSSRKLDSIEYSLPKSKPKMLNSVSVKFSQEYSKIRPNKNCFSIKEGDDQDDNSMEEESGSDDILDSETFLVQLETGTERAFLFVTNAKDLWISKVLSHLKELLNELLAIFFPRKLGRTFCQLIAYERVDIDAVVLGGCVQNPSPDVLTDKLYKMTNNEYRSLYLIHSTGCIPLYRSLYNTSGNLLYDSYLFD